MAGLLARFAPMVTMLEANIQLSCVVEAIESGGQSEVVIARNGRPVAHSIDAAFSAYGAQLQPADQ